MELRNLVAYITGVLLPQLAVTWGPLYSALDNSDANRETQMMLLGIRKSIRAANGHWETRKSGCRLH